MDTPRKLDPSEWTRRLLNEGPKKTIHKMDKTIDSCDTSKNAMLENIKMKNSVIESLTKYYKIQVDMRLKAEHREETLVQKLSHLGRYDDILRHQDKVQEAAYNSSKLIESAKRELEDLSDRVPSSFSPSPSRSSSRSSRSRSKSQSGPRSTARQRSRSSSMSSKSRLRSRSRSLSSSDLD